MSVTRDLKPVLRAMRKDKRYKRLKDAFDTMPLFQLPVDKLADEIETIHKTRSIRIIDVSDPKFVDNLIKANVHDQSARGRLTEIMMQAVRVTSKLEKALKTMRFHLLLTFNNELRGYRTKEERLQIVEMVLKTFTDYIDDMASLRESAQLCVKDIDQGNFSIDKTIRMLEMHIARERRI